MKLFTQVIAYEVLYLLSFSDTRYRHEQDFQVDLVICPKRISGLALTLFYWKLSEFHLPIRELSTPENEFL